jgi:hypothetical protein
MKVRFAPQDLPYLLEMANRLIGTSFAQGYGDLTKLSQRMRFKFSGGNPLVFLTRPERNLLEVAADYRAQTLATASPGSPEHETVTRILEVLRGEPAASDSRQS